MANIDLSDYITGHIRCGEEFPKHTNFAKEEIIFNIKI